MTSATTLPEAAPTRRVRLEALRRGVTPYLLSIAGFGWLGFFFVIPLVSGLLVSLMTGNPDQGYVLTWNWSVYADLFTGPTPYWLYLVRSLTYGLSATAFTIILAFPVAYFIAFRVSARWKTTLLALVMVTFFVSFIIRTDMWFYLLGGNGPITRVLVHLHVLDHGQTFLSTPGSVIGGMVYNDFAFMVLPIYVAMERIDPRLHEASNDLFGNRANTFFRVTVPLTRSGVFSGILLVLIDTVGDPVNSSILGGKETYTIGQAIQNAYFTTQQYNVAAALSTLLMAILGIILFLYARVVGTENIEDLI
ncbi:ABC transporter permease [Nocardioides sp. GY 10127]|uniref:ABC transporter permease n=1 Tax=Nocardioides sp. GY 10127 TaxID=2569762 RepID=UPI0010A8603D|nr:ABC transporter permease [Nocardioides sp. GY 10127]TIC85643.1 ABC transporter permease [Nocardioides sp. GY 10127]